MARTWTGRKCPDCGAIPYPDTSGRMVCDCNNRVWYDKKGIPGSEAERTWLASNGFEETQDVQGDVYYVGPLGHIVHLFDNGEWTSDKAREGMSLESYVEWVVKPIEST